jgi:hypothetical protein
MEMHYFSILAQRFKMRYVQADTEERTYMDRQERTYRNRRAPPGEANVRTQTDYNMQIISSKMR